MGSVAKVAATTRTVPNRSGLVFRLIFSTPKGYKEFTYLGVYQAVFFCEASQRQAPVLPSAHATKTG